MAAEETSSPTRLLAVLNAGGQQALAAAIGDMVRAWLTEHGWADSLEQVSFTTYQDFLSLPPADWPVAAIMLNGDYGVEDRVLTEGEGDFWGWLEAHGLHVETRSHGVHEISVPDDAPSSAGLRDRLTTLQAFEWNAHLVTPDYTTIYHTVFEHFGRHPQHLGDLDWRGFENLCASVFEAQNYTTVLGKGGNDGGVDIRLTEHPVYGERLTVVQVKRYKKKIDIQLVSSILGVAHAEGAARSLFVTSSSFLPSARKFAQANVGSIPLDLADGQQVAEWCRGLLPSPDALRRQAASWTPKKAKIIVAAVGVGMTNWKWAAVVAETPLAARLIPLNALRVRSHADPMVGTETPDLPGGTPTAEHSWTARRSKSGGGDEYHGDDGRFYQVWDKKPRYFDDAD
ncbi:MULTISPECIES: restriction endonuclease [Actinosynnema]|uniref:restriction endonuclease n=1 Tax=Actinosynnema TaxID=40566 RepID=UPI0020A4C9F7|nr:restriction endonuclease [Actinosynnema pretiosum]MCP2097290.1 Restriction endonuclease [Actinosynnema pretiosum]